MNKQLRGTGVALVTPFHSDGSIDFKCFKILIDHIIDGGVEYLVPLGTTGESVTLNKDEKHAVLNFVLEVNEGRKPVVLGLGGNNTRDIVEQLNKLDTEGLTAILSVSPYYNKPSQRGIYEHYKMIANNSPLPVILYNVPPRTGSNIAAETTLQLAAEIKNIIGVKEASGNIEQCMQIINKKPKDFLVVSGEDNLTLPLIACGFDGVISVSGNAFPREFSDMVRAALQNDFDNARRLHYQLMEITSMLFAEGSPAGIKEVLNIKNICQPHLRLPLVGVSDKLKSAMKEVVGKMERVVVH
ncbi:MAG: 4-hydroxy-tetrahydrodipicolinate synthase [Nitrosopumilus sp.]|nr:4-hydroxy-tetrahydrodipicolinate synthase [Nitrosopumilus sp.]